MFSKMARGLIIVGREIPVLIRDLCGLAGAALIAYGAWLIYAPAGYITGGVLLLSGVIALSARAG